jgi:hypothetical protein
VAALPEAFVGHRTPQRLRVRIPSKKGKTLYFSAVTERFGRQKDLALAEVNHRTGSVLFIGDSLDVNAIAEHARKEGLFDLGPSGNAPPHVARSVAAPLGNLSGQVRSFTGGHLDLPGIVFVGLLTVGVVEIARGNFGAPPWYTAFWYAFGVFSRSFLL